MRALAERLRGLAITRFGTFAVTILAALCGLLSCKPDDMADQVKIKPYAASSFYADGTSARPPVAHTVAIEDETSPPEFENPLGLSIGGRWLHPFPPEAACPFEITAQDLERGQKQFEIFCTPCHGQTGAGDGMIVQRGFTPPPTYHSARLRAAPESYFYNVITEGIGAMFPYGQRISAEDRWRVVAYIRALQLSQRAPVEMLSKTERRHLDVGGAK